jgi:hypothetical protein
LFSSVSCVFSHSIFLFEQYFQHLQTPSHVDSFLFSFAKHFYTVTSQFLCFSFQSNL